MSDAIEAVARAIYDAENGIDGDQIADMLSEDDRISGCGPEECIAQVMAVCRMAARAAIEAHTAALLADERRIEEVVRADFLAHGVYHGYTDQAKENEWMRMRGIELRTFTRRLRAMIAAALAPGEERR